MTKRFEDLNDSEVLILFKLTGLSRSCSKRILHKAVNKATDGEFLDLNLKSVFEKILFIKNLVIQRKMKSKMKLNSEINAIWTMQYFF